MQAIIRTYTGIPNLGKRFAQRRNEIEKVIQKVPGYIGYYLVDTPDGAVAITLCRDKQGIDEYQKLALQWQKENMPEVTNRPPQVIIGEVVIDMAGVVTR